jgi:hypothetical protein
MSLARLLDWLVPGVSDAQMAERIDRSFSIVPTARVRRDDVPVELYSSNDDLLEACVRLRAGEHVQPYDAAIQLVLERISKPSYEPHPSVLDGVLFRYWSLERISKPSYELNPSVFDGVMFRYWSIPIAYLENAAAPGAGCTIVFELNMVAELERRRAAGLRRAATAAAAGDVLARLCRTVAWPAAVAVYAVIVYKAAALRCG